MLKDDWDDALEEYLVEKKYAVITANGITLRTGCTKSEAMQYKLELVALDIASGKYQRGFYSVKECEGSV